MKANGRRFALVALIASALAARIDPAWSQASAPDAPAPGTPPGDLSALRSIAADALRLVRGGDLGAARSRVEELEVQWRRIGSTTRGLSAEKRKAIDTALDRVERELRFWRVRRTDSAAALQALIDVIDNPS
ncbi:MAG: hypothetical protein M3Z15_10055 [Pseudomonadota bacterium]|nr:hypothetical protein [Pseudomonadota bacterium]